jgi:uncharacterized protein with NAD-binding domain and iron-sulfur cluster
MLIWKEGDYLLALRGGHVGSIRIARLPPPLHFIVGLLRYRGLPLRDRLSGVPAFAEILLSSDARLRSFDNQTFVDWVKSRGATDALVAHLFEPMIEGLMFLNCHEVSATNVLFDLHYMLRDAGASRLGFFDGGLDEVMIQPIARYVRSRGGTIVTGAEVRRIHFAGPRLGGVELADGRVRDADGCVSALPVHRLCEVLPEVAWGQRYFADLRRLVPVPVIGVQIWFDRKVTPIDNLLLTPDCIFNAYAVASNILTEYRGRAGSIVNFVLAPARHLIAMQDGLIVDRVLHDFRDVFPTAREARAIKWKVVKTPQSFHCQFPGMERFRPDPRTPVANFVLAGEFTRNRYPPCMEGAVMAGIAAARALHASQAPGSSRGVAPHGEV